MRELKERKMTMKPVKNIPALAVMTMTVVLLAFASCAEWTETKSLDIETSRPWDREPELWEAYKANIRDYKSRDHSLIYMRFKNSPENAVSEKAYMRCLPDSIDIVSLTNADNFSQFDAEDMVWMRSVGTKVLYQIDFAGRTEELSDEAKLTACLDKAIASVKKNGLDGWSFTGTPKSGDSQRAALSRKIVEKLSAARTPGQLLVFEGHHAFIAGEDIEKIDLFVLGTRTMENSYDLRNMVTDAEEYGIPKGKTLLAASAEGIYYDNSNKEIPVLEAMADNTVIYGPMAGLALYDMESDYYHHEGNWLKVRSIIERLNPSK